MFYRQEVIDTNDYLVYILVDADREITYGPIFAFFQTGRQIPVNDTIAWKDCALQLGEYDTMHVQADTTDWMRECYRMVDYLVPD